MQSHLEWCIFIPNEHCYFNFIRNEVFSFRMIKLHSEWFCHFHLRSERSSFSSNRLRLGNFYRSGFWNERFSFGMNCHFLESFGMINYHFERSKFIRNDQSSFHFDLLLVLAGRRRRSWRRTWPMLSAVQFLSKWGKRWPESSSTPTLPSTTPPG